MNSPAPTKTLTLLLAAAFLLPGVCVLHGQTGRSHQGYLTLSVHSGSGDGSCYSKGQRVRIGAETPSGFEFVKWFKVKGDGELTSPLEPSGDFTMGSGDSEIAATFAKLETWFPPGPEGTTKGLLLPKPASGQATRLEHRLRVTLNRGPSPGPPYSEIWSALSVKMKWEAATHVRFFTSQSGGQEVKSNTIVPSSSFKPKGEGIYEASLWYQGNLTQKQIAQMSQSGQKPEVKIQLNIAVEGKDKPTSSTASLLPFEVKATSHGFPPTGIPGKYNRTPERGSVDNLIAVWPGEEITLTVDLPEPFKSNPTPGLISWDAPDHNVPANSTEFRFKWMDTGVKTVVINVGSSEFKVVIDLPNVGNTSQFDAVLAIDPLSAASILLYANWAQSYAQTQYPSVVPKRDAIRHSYWTALCVSDILVDQQAVLFVTTAHEHDNKWGIPTFPWQPPNPQEAFNSTMDLRNNLIGSFTSHSTGAGTPDEAAIKQSLDIKYQSGLMWIYDGNTSEGASQGILSKSNRQKIYGP